ncbi:hypothetical protein [Halopiger aswanensis]|uniref:Uncharacterized protein n=1 Tax=Halopiger aswanensis TaxID=148449 RepID=A0A3R7E1K1_9EURY|nr:hypothetical protein [Halopiger aswanensis]RKD97826.1 hypothetical protein ATJ93_0819 [Halopiger aswanensis]
MKSDTTRTDDAQAENEAKAENLIKSITGFGECEYIDSTVDAYHDGADFTLTFNDNIPACVLENVSDRDQPEMLGVETTSGNILTLSVAYKPHLI